MWIIRYYRHLWKQREKLKGVLRCDSESDWLFNNIHKAYHFHSMPNISCLVLSFTLRLILTIIHIWTGGSKTNYVKIISTQHSVVLWLLNPASCTQTLVYYSSISTYVWTNEKIIQEIPRQSNPSFPISTSCEVKMTVIQPIPSAICSLHCFAMHLQSNSNLPSRSCSLLMLWVALTQFVILVSVRLLECIISTQWDWGFQNGSWRI